MKPLDEVTTTTLSSIVGGASFRQRLQRRPLQGDLLLMAGVAAADQRVDEGAIGVDVVEVAAAAQQQGVLDRLFEMAMGALDGAVLMGDAAIVAARRHAVVGAERLIAAGDVVLGLAIEIAKGCRQTVAAMLLGRAAQ